jgi:hypothetical protein
MELLFILGLIGLGVWIWTQTQRIEVLTRKVDALERRLAEQQEPLLLDQPLPPEEPLLLVTPVPEASNDMAKPAASAAARAVASPQSLGVLAVAAAFFAPLLANAAAWPSAALALYACAAGAAGFAVAALQRWVWLALATFAGLHLWFAAAIVADDAPRALALACFASIGGAALALRASARDETSPLNWAHVRALAPGVAVSIGAVLVVWTWLALSSAPSLHILGPALAAGLHVALAAYAVRRRGAAPAVLAAAIGATVLGFAAYQRARFFYGPIGEGFYPTALFAALAVAVAALAARPHRSGRAQIAAIGAIGAALLVTLASFSRPDWHAPAAWSALFAGALLLFTAAGRAAAETSEPRLDPAVDFWAGAAAGLVLLGVESGFPGEARTVGHAAAALAFAAGLARRGWRVLQPAALLAAILSFAYVIGLVGSLMAGEATPWRAGLLLAVAAALLFAARACAVGGARRAVDALARDASRVTHACMQAALAGARAIGAWLRRLRASDRREPTDLPGVTPGARRERRRGRRRTSP